MPRSTSQPTTRIFKRLHSAICKVQLILRRLRKRSWRRGRLCTYALTFSRLLVHQPHVAPRRPPRSFFFASAFCELQLVSRSCLSSQGKAWQALHLSLTFSKFFDATPHTTSQPTPQIFQLIFYKCILQAAIDFAEVRMRSCCVERNAAGSSAWQTLH